jgi:hypothetical protein
MEYRLLGRTGVSVSPPGRVDVLVNNAGNFIAGFS